MRIRPILLLLVLALVLPATGATAATAVVDAEITLNLGDSDTYSSGPVPGGANPGYFEVDAVCDKSPGTYCEHVLLELVNPVADDGDPTTDLTDKESLRVDLTTAAADYDLFLYASDADGTIGGELAASTSFPLGDFSESAFSQITTRESQDTVYVLARVVFFAPVTPMTLDVSFT